jgi:predicted outer membrane repeat protein
MYVGAAISLYQGNMFTTIEDCYFLENFASGSGGAIYAVVYNTQFNITSCRFYSNTATYGGSVYFYDSNINARIQDSIFVSNEAIVSGGMFELN